MSALTGLGPIETGLLESYDTIGAHPNHPHVKNSRVLRELSQTHGIAPHFGFTMICSTARPDLTHLSWIDSHGNYG